MRNGICPTLSRLMSKWYVGREKQCLFYDNAADFTEIRTVEGGEAEGDFL